LLNVNFNVNALSPAPNTNNQIKHIDNSRRFARKAVKHEPHLRKTAVSIQNKFNSAQISTSGETETFNKQQENSQLIKQISVSDAELNDHAEMIINSGDLGRSKVYGALLRYLISCANSSSSPKEIEIAIEVLGRNTDFDVGKDSVVRVYIHQLRKKLDIFYAKREKYSQEHSEAPLPFRIIIPKGQYTIIVAQIDPSEPNDENATQGSSKSMGGGNDSTNDIKDESVADNLQKQTKHRLHFWLAAASLLLAANLVFQFVKYKPQAPTQESFAAQHLIWKKILNDETPILLVTGDYYIFGELDDAGNVVRMVRDFSINSKQDLDSLFAQQPELAWQYYDLNLSYLPEGTAFAINHIAPLLQSTGKTVGVKMMSELNTQDLQKNHVVYLGYISALDRLKNIVFAGSNLSIGENYDQLVHKQTGEIYTSDAGLPSFGKPFVDFGLFSTFPSTQNTQIFVLAGMRDAGLMQITEALVSESSLEKIGALLLESEKNSSGAIEVLFKVQGLDRMNFNAELEHADYLDSELIWK